MIVVFRYLSCVVLEASKVLSKALTANQKEIDGNDITLQHCKEIMTKTEEAIKTVSFYMLLSNIISTFQKKNYVSKNFTWNIYICSLKI